MHRTDSHAASPWVIDIRAIGLTKHDGPGLVEPLEITATAPKHTASPVLDATGAQVRVDGRLESVSEGVLASAQVHADASGSCSRCLDPISVPLDVTIQELYAYPDSVTAETTDADEIPLVTDETIDLEPLIHDELVLAMPAIPVCADDCQGLCPECGERMDSVGPDHAHETIDPRWAALADMTIVSPAGQHVHQPERTDSDTAGPGAADSAAAPNQTKEK